MVEGVRSPEVAAKIDLHLERFRAFFVDLYGHERISTVGRRDVVDWQRDLTERLAPATVNNYVASLSGFTSWVNVQAPGLFTTGNPSTGGNSTDTRLSDLVSHLDREFGAFVKV